MAAGETAAAAVAALGALAKQFGLPDTATHDEVLAAVQADPEADLKLVQAEQAFQLASRDQDIKVLQTTLTDIQGARGMHIAHIGSDTNLYVLAWVIVVGFFALLALMLQINIPEEQNSVVFMLFGALSSGFGQVLAFFFGSSSGDAMKTKLIAQAPPIK